MPAPFQSARMIYTTYARSVRSLSKHDCGGYCDKCAEELWNDTPTRDKKFYELMQRFMTVYEALMKEYGDTKFARHFHWATHNLVVAKEIMEIECGMDDQ